MAKKDQNPFAELAKKHIGARLPKYVKRNYKGDWKKGFNAYAGKHPPKDKVQRKALKALLSDAGVWSIYRTDVVVDTILANIDTSTKGKDRGISWKEFSDAFLATKKKKKA